MNLTYVCFACRKTFRKEGNAEAHHCPYCGGKLRHVNAAPPLSKPEVWEALQRQKMRQETGFQLEAVQRINSALMRGYELERREREGRLPSKRLRHAKKAQRKAEQHRKKLASTLGKLVE